MHIFTKKAGLKAYLDKERKKGKSIGFVPTMGALHEGHLSLIIGSRKDCDVTVCSIFVNPTQFNNADDFRKYPRVVEADRDLLEKASCDVLFLPDVEEMYAGTKPIRPDLDGLDTRLEGEFRPGHFDGVVQIVYLLLKAVKPDRLYMGLKDYQQQLIVGRMIREMKLPVTLVAEPTMREKNGLAMSSRNMRLTPVQREEAAAIYAMLTHAAQSIKEGLDVPEVLQKAESELADFDCKPEYIVLCDAETLLPLERYDPDRKAILLAAVWWGDVRLIDNLVF
ncbi:MAG TPA: pantoate--beta-alanine ligase [Saprospiraceae bacterium]|jgi:pantoate--beta-alanine ligase|nr:pantoate--beta-alanine ligase [Saprospiraceae bacterium]HRP83946.1 pantoate--beta-alanine ligase [Saprospiraceae bacterium]